MEKATERIQQLANELNRGLEAIDFVKKSIVTNIGQILNELYQIAAYLETKYPAEFNNQGQQQSEQ